MRPLRDLTCIARRSGHALQPAVSRWSWKAAPRTQHRAGRRQTSPHGPYRCFGAIHICQIGVLLPWSVIFRSELIDSERTTAGLAVLGTAKHPDSAVPHYSQVSGQDRRYRTDIGQVEKSQQTRRPIRDALEANRIDRRNTKPAGPALLRSPARSSSGMSRCESRMLNVVASYIASTSLSSRIRL